MIASVPLSASWTLPETGASSIARSERAGPLGQPGGLLAGLTVLMSTYPASRPPGRRVARRGPPAIASRAASSVTMLKTTLGGGRDLARRFAPDGGRARSASWALALVRFQPYTWWPAASSRLATRLPIAPRPTNPMRAHGELAPSISATSSSLSSRPPRRGSGRPGRAGGSRRSRRRRPGCAASRRPRRRRGWSRGVRRPPSGARRARGCARAAARGSARRACASRPRAAARSARGSCRRSASPSPSASRRSRRSRSRSANGRISCSTSRSISEYWRLQRLHGSDLLDPLQLLDVEVGDADVAHEPLLLELGERRPALLDVLRRDRPVDLVEVDRVDAEPLEAAVALRAGSSRASGCA